MVSVGRLPAITLALSMWCGGLPLAPIPVAQASGDSVAILPLQVGGALSEADRQSLSTSLASGFERGSLKITGPNEVVAAMPGADGCSSKACFKSAAKATGARYVVRTTVDIQDRDYQVSVELLDGKSGDRVANSQDSCEICGVADAAGLLSAAAATISVKLDALAKGPAALTLTSSPNGALVTLDGEIIGTTPIERTIAPGKHLLRLSKDGYIAIEREVTFVDGVSEELDIELEKLPSRLPGRRWGYASLGIGIAALGGGVALTAIHDLPHSFSCSGENLDMNGQCRYLFNTKWYGAAALIGGAALTTLGVAILLNSRKKTRKETKKTAFGIGPGSVSLSGRF
ncbi:MAG: PEGA domain-containing protein [Nannocystaceae bacterium]